MASWSSFTEYEATRFVFHQNPVHFPELWMRAHCSEHFSELWDGTDGVWLRSASDCKSWCGSELWSRAQVPVPAHFLSALSVAQSTPVGCLCIQWFHTTCYIPVITCTDRATHIMQVIVKPAPDSCVTPKQWVHTQHKLMQKILTILHLELADALTSIWNHLCVQEWSGNN